MPEMNYAQSIGAADAPLTSDDLPQLQAGESRVLDLMKDELWHTSDAIKAAASDCDGGRASEGLRRMRSLRQHGYQIHKRRVPGTRDWEYKLEATQAVAAS